MAPLSDVFGGQPPGGTRLVLHHHLLAQNFAELGADQAGKNVVAAAGREADDHPDRLGWITGLCRRRHGRRDDQQQRGKRGAKRTAGEQSHQLLHPWLSLCLIILVRRNGGCR
jgi:hypothetical protein